MSAITLNVASAITSGEIVGWLFGRRASKNPLSPAKRRNRTNMVEHVAVVGVGHTPAARKAD